MWQASKAEQSREDQTPPGLPFSGEEKTVRIRPPDKGVGGLNLLCIAFGECENPRKMNCKIENDAHAIALDSKNGSHV